jgi:hypothetical protein
MKSPHSINYYFGLVNQQWGNTPLGHQGGNKVPPSAPKADILTIKLPPALNFTPLKPPMAH